MNGVCTGSGLHFVADADFVVASATASFLDTHVSVGQVAALEPISLLPRIGIGNALGWRSWVGTAGWPRRALRISLVDEVVEPAQLLDRAVELAEPVATGSPAAVEASKRAIRAPSSARWRRRCSTAGSCVAHRGHPDSIEGPKAFAEKREARWQ